MLIITFIALLVATLIPLGVLWFIRSRNMYQTGSFKMVLGSFFWGIVIYGIVALFNSQVLIGQGIVDGSTLVKFITPWQEEILKAAMGRSGNLRAPTLKTKNAVYIGFNEEIYTGL